MLRQTVSLTPRCFVAKVGPWQWAVRHYSPRHATWSDSGTLYGSRALALAALRRGCDYCRSNNESQSDGETDHRCVACQERHFAAAWWGRQRDDVWQYVCGAEYAKLPIKAAWSRDFPRR